MMGDRKELQQELFYEFSLEDHVPADHLLRSIDQFVDLSEIRRELASFYSAIGRPSIDPELMIRMLLVGYTHGIRSERRLCQEVHLNLAYRWFCKLDLNDGVPDHSTFSKNRLGRFRDSGLFRKLFEMVLTRCIEEGFVGWMMQPLAHPQRWFLSTFLQSIPQHVGQRRVRERPIFCTVPTIWSTWITLSLSMLKQLRQSGQRRSVHHI